MKRLPYHSVVATGSSLTSRRWSSTAPSFVAGLFKRQFNSKEMFPYPQTKIDSTQHQRLDGLLNDINDKGNASGTRAMSVAAEHGGLSLSHTARAAVLETVAEAKMLTDVYAAQHTCTCAHLINSFGDEAARATFLPLIASGESNFAFAFTEFDHEVDISMCTTSADESGAITGAKTLRGMFSKDRAITHFIVIAKTKTNVVDFNEGATTAARSTIYIVKNDPATVKVEGATATFTKAPAVATIGAVGEGFSAMMVSKHTMRYGHDAAIIGTCKGLYHTLEALGDAIPKSVLSYVSSLIYGMEAGVYALTANMDGLAPDSLIDAAFASINVHYSAKKILSAVEGASRENISTTSNTSDFALFSTQLRSLLQSAEPVESLQNIAACCGVEDFGLSFQSEGTLTTMGGRMGRSLGAKQRIPLKVTWPEVAPIEDQFAAFGDAVESVFVKYGPSLRHKQLALERVAKSGAFLFAACASVSRAAKQDKKPTGAGERALCKTLLPILTSAAAAEIVSITNTARSGDDALVRVVGEMMHQYVPIDENSAEIAAEDAAQKQIDDEKKAKEELEKKQKEEAAKATIETKA
eukprot:GILI01023620.1.p1 GENE.GILI01023620.1~~GILI01023620.1.p1  ORF type:complete len:582 (+),score=137.44 GILI01023620.1:33-1778(+)